MTWAKCPGEKPAPEVSARERETAIAKAKLRRYASSNIRIPTYSEGRSAARYTNQGLLDHRPRFRETSFFAPPDSPPPRLAALYEGSEEAVLVGMAARFGDPGAVQEDGEGVRPAGFRLGVARRGSKRRSGCPFWRTLAPAAAVE